ncbi:MAG: LacI family DNA-binding transcriptional regulator [Lentisphaeria bacterium]|nr:LacI family DNA-binding transcriptional regulator [Lentisphaeria bacterium]
MSEIGKLAGVSQPTVSVVINGKGKEKGIAEATRKRILDIAREYGFRPNALARSMKTGQTGIIGVLVDKEAMIQTVNDYDSGTAIMNLHASLLIAGCKVMLEAVDDEDCRNLKMPELLTSGLVDGIIACACGDDIRYLEKMRAYTDRILLFDNIQDVDASIVAIDDEETGMRAADYLWDKGFRSFGMISCSEHRLALDARMEGFAKRIGELSGNSLPVVSAFAGNRWEPECGGDAVRKLLAETHRCPDAIFCSNDFFAYGAEIELLKQGYSVPDDVALIAVGESQLGKSAPVPITSFVPPSGKITEGVLDICKMWSKGKKDLVKTCIEPVLFERRSTLK